MVFICPGGGYEFVSHKEGEPLALQFTAMGYHAAVLTSSVKPAVYPTQLLEIAQAWKIIRENADRWNVLTDKIIIMGGSAGGHLAASYGIFSGVDFIATLHAASPEEAVGRPQVQALQVRGALHVLVWLKGRAEPGQVREVRFL